MVNIDLEIARRSGSWRGYARCFRPPPDARGSQEGVSCSQEQPLTDIRKKNVSKKTRNLTFSSFLPSLLSFFPHLMLSLLELNFLFSHTFGSRIAKAIHVESISHGLARIIGLWVFVVCIFVHALLLLHFCLFSAVHFTLLGDGFA